MDEDGFILRSNLAGEKLAELAAVYLAPFLSGFKAFDCPPVYKSGPIMTSKWTHYDLHKRMVPCCAVVTLANHIENRQSSGWKILSAPIMIFLIECFCAALC